MPITKEPILAQSKTFSSGRLSNSSSTIFYVFLAGWVLINLFQATFVDLAHDEAYYWVWSRFPQWGYMEHPPMIAWLIQIGYSLIPNETGVRITTILGSGASLWIMYSLSNKKDPVLFVGITSSILLLHAGGFMAVPDAPLVFFVCLFFFALKKYYSTDNILNSLLLLLSVVGIIYSKYHGFLVIGLTILSNFQLLKKKSFWVISVTASILYLPHLFWLYTDGIPGLEYALSGRFKEALQSRHILSYFFGQLVVLGALISPIILYAGFRYKPADPFEKSLKFVLGGILFFFLFWSFKGRIEANWTAAVILPLIILSNRYIANRPALRKSLLFLATPSVLFMLIMRIQLATGIIPVPFTVDKTKEFMGWEQLAKKLNSSANGKLFLAGDYKVSSKIWFYTGKPCIPHGGNNRITQFDLWEMHQSYEGKEVTLFARNNFESNDSLALPTGGYNQLVQIPSYHHYGNLIPSIEMPDEIFHVGDEISISVRIIDQTGANNWTWHEGLAIGYEFYQKGKKRPCKENFIPICHRTVELKMMVQFPKEPGIYKLYFRLATLGQIRWKRDEGREIKVEEIK